MVQKGLLTDVLLALLEAPAQGIDGGTLQARLVEHGRRVRTDQLLGALLQLEGTDHVLVDRHDGYAFALSDTGRERAVELGGGRPVHVRLLMVDLVDFTAFTAAHGDVAAHDAARALAAAVRGALVGSGGSVVKELGDGVLAWLPPDHAPLPVAREVAGACQRPDGGTWSLRASSHVGHPIRSRGDLFGADVNLVARLCDLAAPDELVTTVDGAAGIDATNGSSDRLDVLGVAEPVVVRREPLR